MSKEAEDRGKLNDRYLALKQELKEVQDRFDNFKACYLIHLVGPPPPEELGFTDSLWEYVSYMFNFKE